MVAKGCKNTPLQSTSSPAMRRFNKGKPRKPNASWGYASKARPGCRAVSSAIDKLGWVNVGAYWCILNPPSRVLRRSMTIARPTNRTMLRRRVQCAPLQGGFNMQYRWQSGDVWLLRNVEITRGAVRYGAVSTTTTTGRVVC